MEINTNYKYAYDLIEELLELDQDWDSYNANKPCGKSLEWFKEKIKVIENKFPNMVINGDNFWLGPDPDGTITLLNKDKDNKNRPTIREIECNITTRENHVTLVVYKLEDTYVCKKEITLPLNDQKWEEIIILFLTSSIAKIDETVGYID